MCCMLKFQTSPYAVLSEARFPLQSLSLLQFHFELNCESLSNIFALIVYKESSIQMFSWIWTNFLGENVEKHYGKNII